MAKARRRPRPSRPAEQDGDEGNRLVKAGVFVWVKRTTVRRGGDRIELGGYYAKVLEPARTTCRGSWWAVRELASWGTYTVNAAWCRVPRILPRPVLEYQQLLLRMRSQGLRALAGRK